MGELDVNRIAGEDLLDALCPFYEDNGIGIFEHLLESEMYQVSVGCEAIAVNMNEMTEILLFQRIYFHQHERGTFDFFFHAECVRKPLYKRGLASAQFPLERQNPRAPAAGRADDFLRKQMRHAPRLVSRARLNHRHTRTVPYFAWKCERSLFFNTYFNIPIGMDVEMKNQGSARAQEKAREFREDETRGRTAHHLRQS